MIRLGCSIFAVALASGCAGQPAPTELAANSGRGMVTVAGVSSARVLGAIDTSKLVKNPDVAHAGDPSSTTTQANGAEGITVEGVEPAAVLAAIDPTKLVGPDKNEKTKAPKN